MLIIDYRGYGSSTGAPSERGLELDGEAALEYALNCKDINPRKLIVYGKSLGGAVAAYLAQRRQNEVMAFILENTFTSMGAMIDQHMPHLKLFKSFLLRSRWPSLERVKEIRRPTLFIYGENDEIIDCKNMLTLYDSATKAAYKQIHMVKNGDHNTCYMYGGESYLNTISTFIQKVVRDFPLDGPQDNTLTSTAPTTCPNHAKSD